MRSAALLSLTLASMSACTSTQPRYLVSATPMSLVDPRHPGICVAVDPADPRGVWWWEPGRSGCSSRSTGPAVFRADAARVTPAHDRDELEVTFEIQLMNDEPRQVRLDVRGDRMREPASGRDIAAVRRANLELPEQPPPSR